MSDKKWRYEPNQTYPFLMVDYTRGEDRFGSLYLPWVDTLNKINLVMLTVLEAHDVAWMYDPDNNKQYQGFVFTDENMEVWHNQYPYASYGQMDDSQDWVARPTASIGYSDDEVLFGYVDAVHYIEKLASALTVGGMSSLPEDSIKERVALKIHLDEVIALVEKAMGKTIQLFPWEFTDKNGNHRVIKTAMRVTFSPNPANAA